MAVKYYAEIVRETPSTKNVCNEQVYYAVRVFKGDTTDPSIEDQLTSFARIEVGTSDERRAVVTTKNVADLVEGQVIKTHDTFWDPLDENYFRVGFTSSKPGTYTPKFTIKIYEPFQAILPGLSNASTSSLVASTEQADINSGSLPVTIVVPRQSNSKNWGQISYNPAKWQTVTIPSIAFTKKAVAPDRTTALAQGSASTLDGWGWDSCNKRWVGVFFSYQYRQPKSPYATKTANPTDPLTSSGYNKQIKYFVKAILQADLTKYPNATWDDHVAAGRLKTVWTANGWDWVATGKAFVEPKTTPTISTQSYKNDAIATRKKFESANCAAITGSPAPAPAPATVTLTESLKQAESFNPPPHIITRHFSPIAWGGDGMYGQDKQGNSLNNLGMIYQDPDTVTNVAKVYGSTVQKFWGFRFMFNPTFVSYSMSASNTVDWTRGNPNNAVLITDGVGGTINLRLVLDRVADMNTMRRWDLEGKKELETGRYPINLTPEQCDGILYRGTEYDLEYMFRVFNGNPEKSTLLGNPKGSLEMSTANLGYVTSLPFVLKLNDQQRYKVILTGLNVQHDLFTHDMIPVRTLIDFSVERIPDFYSKKSKYLTIDTQTQLIKTLPAAATNSNSGGGSRGAVVD
jgi:hypothetical protein